MLKEFLESISAQVRRGDAATVLEVPSRPRELLVSQGGHYAWEDKKPPLRAVKLTALHSLNEFLTAHVGAAHVFLAESGVTALLDEKDRRETVSLSLTKTDVWKMLVGLSVKWYGFPTDKIVRQLRQMGTDSGVISTLRKIDFKRQAQAVADVKHGRESLGRQVEASVQGAENIPERFQIETAVFTEAGCRRKVLIDVDLFLNVQEESIDLRVSPDSLDMAMAEVLEDIRESIEAAPGLTGVRVFMGSP